MPTLQFRAVNLENTFRNISGIILLATTLIPLFIGSKARDILVNSFDEIVIIMTLIITLLLLLSFRKYIDNVGILLGGTLAMVLSLVFFLSFVLQIYAGEVMWSASLTQPLVLALVGILLIFPMLEWIALTRPNSSAALLPFQQRLSQLLMKLSGGRILLVVIYYTIVLSLLFLAIQLLITDVLTTLLVVALIIPVINLGYLSGYNLGNDLLQIKLSRSEYAKTQSHWINITWDKKILGIFQKFSLAMYSAAILAVLLVVSSIYGTYTSIAKVINPSLVTLAFLGFADLVRLIILKLRNTLNQTSMMWDAQKIFDTSSKFTLSYPFYVGISIIMLLLVKIITGFSISDDIFVQLSISADLQIFLLLLALESIVLLTTTLGVFVVNHLPIEFREVDVDTFSRQAPVIQYQTLESWYDKAKTLEKIEDRLAMLTTATTHGGNRYTATKLTDFLLSQYDELRNHARNTFRDITTHDIEIGQYFIDKLKGDEIEQRVKEVITGLLSWNLYLPQLQDLATAGKIRANWLTMMLEFHVQPVEPIYVDETHIFVGSWDGSISAWDRITHNLEFTMEGVAGDFNDIKSMTGNSTHVYAGAYDGQLLVFDKISKQLIESLQLHDSGCLDMALKDDILYIIANDGHIQLVSTNDLQVIAVIEDYPERGWAIFVDDSYIYSAHGNATQDSPGNTVCVWDLQTRQLVTTLDGHIEVVNAVYADQEYIYTGSGNGLDQSRDVALRIYSKRDFSLVREITLQDQAITSITADDNAIYTASRDRTIAVIDRSSFELIKMLDQHTSVVLDVILYDNYLVSTSQDSTLRIWDVVTITDRTETEGHSDGINDVTQDNKRLYTASWDSTVRIWNKKKLQLIYTLEGHEGIVYAVAVDDNHIYSSASDGTVKIWDKQGYDLLKSISLPEGNGWSLKATENYLYVAVDHHYTHRIAIKNLEIVDTIKDTGYYFAVDNQHFYSAKRDILCVWTISNLKMINSQENVSLEGINDIFVDDNYIYVTTGHMNSENHDNSVKIFRKSDLQQVASLRGHSLYVRSVFADKYYIYSSADDATIRVYNKSTFTQETVLEDHDGGVSRVIVDDRSIYSVSDDKKLLGHKKLPSRNKISALLPYLVVVLIPAVVGSITLLSS